MNDKSLETLGYNAKRVGARHQMLMEAIDNEREAHRKLLERLLKIIEPALPAICTTPVSTGGRAQVYVATVIPEDPRHRRPGLYLAAGGAFLEGKTSNGTLELAPLPSAGLDDPYGCGEVARRWKARGIQTILREIALLLDRQLAGKAKATMDKAQARANKVHAILELLDG